MHSLNTKKILMTAGVFLLLWLSVRYLLSLVFPFLLGAVIAVGAEPAVRLVTRKMSVKRGFATGVGVSLTLILLAAVLSLVGALAVKEVAGLAGRIPQLTETAQQGIVLLQDWMIHIADRAPENIQPAVKQTVLNFFTDGSAVMQQVAAKVPGAVSAVLGWVPDGLLGVGTALISAFLISMRLPRIREFARTHLPDKWRESYLPALGRMRSALGGWLKAQLKLAAVTYGIVGMGFLLLRIPYGLVWAALVAFVDAVPLLGTGTVLVPWSIISFLQGRSLEAVGLLCIYGAAAIARAVLEPKLVGRQLGLDPLVTLLALYVGYQLWGVMGMLTAPILATAAKSVFLPNSQRKN